MEKEKEDTMVVSLPQPTQRDRTEAPKVSPDSPTTPIPMMIGTSGASLNSFASPQARSRPAPSAHSAPRTPRPLRVPSFTLPGGEALFPAISAIGMLGFAALLWYTDGYFTLLFLREHWPQIGTWGVLQWSIPVLVTMMTLWTWPRRVRFMAVRVARQQWVHTEHEHDARRYFRYRTNFLRRTLFFIAVVLFNMGTSVSGLSIWVQGRTFDLFGGITIPESGWPLWAFAIFGGAVCAFAPEKIGRWAADELKLLGGDDD